MSRNIEVKARVKNMDVLQSRAAQLAGKLPAEITQEDVFFACPKGRLKLRLLAGGKGELVSYQRPDQTGIKESEYFVYRTEDPQQLLQTLTHAFGQIGVVKKHRMLYMVGRTRIHLDRVEGLGDFMELEVVLEEGEPSSAGVEEAKALMKELGIEQDQTLDVAYFDLICGQN